MVAGTMIIRPETAVLTYHEACRIAGTMNSQRPGTLLLNLEGVSDVTTPALARLIALRRDILRASGDLRIAQLSGRARNVYEVNRLSSVLPESEEDALGIARQEY